MMFRDRTDAGRRLAERLKQYSGQKDVTVLGLPRGGVVTAAVVAQALNFPLDIVVPRKIGAPGNEEFAIGAVSENGAVILDERIVSMLGIQADYIEQMRKREVQEAERRLRTYRGGLPERDLAGKMAVIVDDGVATGMTMRAAIASARTKSAKCVIVATPVIAPDTLVKLQPEADEVVYLDAPAYFGAVGQFYERFEQTSDEEVVRLLHENIKT